MRLGIKELLLTIIESKELDRHWLTKEKENAKLFRATRKADHDRKRLEQGSAYASDEDEKNDVTDSEEEYSSDYDSEEYDEEVSVIQDDSTLDNYFGDQADGIQMGREPISG